MKKGIIKVGDKIKVDGYFFKAKVESIEIVKGLNKEGRKVKRHSQQNIVVCLSNGHWARGSQIRW